MHHTSVRRGPRLAWTALGASIALLLLVGLLRLAIPAWPLALVVTACVVLIASMASGVILHRGLVDSRAEIVGVHGQRRFWIALSGANGSTALDIVSLLLTVTALG